MDYGKKTELLWPYNAESSVLWTEPAKRGGASRQCTNSSSSSSRTYIL